MASSATSAAHCRTIFAFPQMLAGTMIPSRLACQRSSVTASSRPSTTTTIHVATWSLTASATSAPPMSSLSAIGSASFPNVLTASCRRAIWPSATSVAAARTKMATASADPSGSLAIASTRSGTSAIRKTVRTLGTCRQTDAASVMAKPWALMPSPQPKTKSSARSRGGLLAAAQRVAVARQERADHDRHGADEKARQVVEHVVPAEVDGREHGQAEEGPQPDPHDAGEPQEMGDERGRERDRRVQRGEPRDALDGVGHGRVVDDLQPLDPERVL